MAQIVKAKKRQELIDIEKEHEKNRMNKKSENETKKNNKSKK